MWRIPNKVTGARRVYRYSDPLSGACLASLALRQADHVDAVAVPLASGTTALQFVRAALLTTPDWIRTLMNIRDAVVRPFGLRASAQKESSREITVGRRLGPFNVLAMTDDEVLLGDDDKHLRFRTSFAVRIRASETEGVCTTVVAYNNVVGRVYFALVRPFHNLIVSALVGQAARALSDSS